MTDLEELERYRSLGVPIEELEEYVKAKKEYRTGIFPVAMHQRAYVIDNGHPHACIVNSFKSKVIGNWKITLRDSLSHNWLMQDRVRTFTVDLAHFGKTWFASKEDAEAFLDKKDKKEKKKNHANC